MACGSPRLRLSRSAAFGFFTQLDAGLGGLMDQGLGLGGGDKDNGICVSRHAGLAYDDDCQTADDESAYSTFFEERESEPAEGIKFARGDCHCHLI